MAIVSLVLGIVGLLVCFGFPGANLLMSIPGVICGHKAKAAARAAGASKDASGLAQAGLITGYIGVVVGGIAAVVVAILVVIAVNAPPQP